MKTKEAFPALLLIGQFSKLSGLSCRMLRFYAEQDILVPAYTDCSTGYRHYLASQLTEAKLLRQLRQADFSLGDIAALLNGGKRERWSEYAAAQRESISQKIRALEMALEELDQIERCEGPQEYLLTRLAPMRVLSAPLPGERLRLREMARSHASRLLGEDAGEAAPLFCIYDIHTGPAGATLCMPTDEPAGELLPGGLLAAALHRGPYETLPATLEGLLSWVGEKRYTPDGRVWERYFPCGEEACPHGRVEVAVSLTE